MKISTAIIITYVIGLLLGAFVMGLWDAETSPKSLLGMIWTALFLIALYFVEFKNE